MMSIRVLFCASLQSKWGEGKGRGFYESRAGRQGGREGGLAHWKEARTLRPLRGCGGR